MQSLFIRPKDLAVIPEQLAANKIEKSSARLTSTANQIDIGVGEIDHPRNAEVRVGVLLFNGVQRQLTPILTVIKLKMIVRDEAIRHQTLGPEADQLDERTGSRGLQTGQDRHGLQERSLPRSITPDDTGRLRVKFYFQIRKTTEIP